jgi:hypothetical protein
MKRDGFKNVISFGNEKINNQAKKYHYRVGTTFDLLCGYTCPMANLCNSRVIETKQGLRIKWGKNAIFTCYMAKAEARRPVVYFAHKFNTEFTGDKNFIDVMKAQIWLSGTTLHRWHAGGDFYSWEYFQKVYEISKSFPDIYFYAYTKVASFHQWFLEHKLPNMDMIYSMGGKQDKYAIEHNLPSCTVITDKQYKFSDITDEGLPIACQKHNNKYDDLYYIQNQISFGIYVH